MPCYYYDVEKKCPLQTQERWDSRKAGSCSSCLENPKNTSKKLTDDELVARELGISLDEVADLYDALNEEQTQ